MVEQAGHVAAGLIVAAPGTLQDELTRNKCRPKSIDVWQRGVDTDVFNPKHKSVAMRARMTDGHPEAPLLVYVGRLGAEKNTEALKDILQQVIHDDAAGTPGTAAVTASVTHVSLHDMTAVCISDGISRPQPCSIWERLLSKP
jgi:glycosyltransferase involved in cell wall biosynthesis